MPNQTTQSRPLVALLGFVSIACLMFSLHAQSQESSQSGSQTKQSTGKSTSAGASSMGTEMRSSGKLNSADEKLLKELAQANLTEINAGKMAEQKSDNAEVKTFAQKMITDHSKSLDELKQIAQAKGVSLPNEPDSKQLAMEKKLSALSGAQFDRQYIDQSGRRAHRDTHRLLQRASSRAEDADLKAYASKTLPTVESHQQLATDTRKELKTTSEGKSGTGTTEKSGGSYK